MGIRKAQLDMIKAMNGGIECMAAGLGMSACALTNRIYEKKGQAVSVSDNLAMQVLSGTTRFAEEVALLSGGTFMKLPEVTIDKREDLMTKFLDLQAELGLLSSTFKKAIEGDDEIDRGERASIESIADDMHRTLSEMTGLMFAIYCKEGA